MSTAKIGKKIVERLRDAGFIAYFAGGWVRDYIMGHPSSDVDIATNASAKQVQGLFRHTIPVGMAFESLVVVEEGEQFEVSSFRTDLEYTDGRKPDAIVLATPEEDAQRRDFTINGLFFDPIEEKVFDFVGGRRDIEKGVVRAIGNPEERFREDRLRMIRGVRMAARFAFNMDGATEAAIRRQASTLFPSVAMERVWQELEKMRAYPRFDQALLELHRLGLLPVIFPRLEGLELGVLKARLLCFQAFPEDVPTILYLLQLFWGLGEEDLEELCRYLKTSNRDRELALRYRRGQDLVQREEEKQQVPDLFEWAHYYAQSGATLCLEVMASHYHEEQRAAFLEHHELRRGTLEDAIRRIRERDPVVKAQDLMELGVPRGRRLGALMREAERLSVNQGLSDPQQVLERLRSSVLWRREFHNG